MKINKLYILSFVCLLFTICGHFIHHKRYLSYVQQVKLYSDLTGANYKNTPSEFYNNIEVNIPNLTSTTIPLKALKAIYITANEPRDSIKKALNLLHKSIAENPYLMFSEGNLAQTYFSLRQKDSADYYARKSFNGLPKNAIHFAMIAKLYANNNKFDSIIYSYDKINSPLREDIGKIYLASLNGFYNTLDLTLKEKALSFTNDLKNRFHENKELQLLADYIIEGKIEVEKALNFEDQGSKLLEEGEYSKGIDFFIKALEIRKNNLEYISTLGLAYYNILDYNKSIEYLEKLENLGIKLDPVSLYVKGISHLNIKQYTLACDYLSQASKFEQKSAIKAFKQFCQRQ